jgi:hypothetical protein
MNEAPETSSPGLSLAWKRIIAVALILGATVPVLLAKHTLPSQLMELMLLAGIMIGVGATLLLPRGPAATE